MLVDSNKLPRTRGAGLSNFDTLDAAIYRSGPALLVAFRPICVRVRHYAISHVLCQGTVNDGPNPHRSSRVSTDVGSYEPLVLENTFQPLLKPTDMVARGDQVAQEEYIRSMLQDKVRYFRQGAHKMSAAII